MGGYLLPSTSLNLPRQHASPFVVTFVSKLLTTVLVLGFCAYPTLVRVSLSFFACVQINVAGQGPYPEYATAIHPRGY